MLKQKLISTAVVGSLALAPLAGCANLPGNAKGQGAVIGAAGGALAGAAVSKNERLLGALIGGALGAGGGYLIGANKDKLDNKKQDEAVRASERAERDPARVEDVENVRTADLNDDGFVTLDEVVAMQRAKLSDNEMVERLERTQQVFELTDQQERYLEDRGVSRDVVLEMRNMNQDVALAGSASEGRDRDELRRDERRNETAGDDLRNDDRRDDNSRTDNSEVGREYDRALGGSPSNSDYDRGGQISDRDRY